VPPPAAFPLRVVDVDWDPLIAQRPTVLATVEAMPAYLLKPEVLGLTPANFIDDGYDFGVILNTLKQRPGRPLKVVSQLLGHRSIASTEIYTRVLTVDGGHFLEGVDFH
jgi:hypothetical protein